MLVYATPFSFFFSFSLLLSVAETRAWVQLHVQMWNKMTIKVLFILTFNLDLWVPAFSLPLEQLPYHPTGVIKSWKENAPYFRKCMQIAWKVLQMNCNVCYAWCNPKSRQLPSVARTATMLHFQGATISSGDGSIWFKVLPNCSQRVLQERLHWHACIFRTATALALCELVQWRQTNCPVGFILNFNFRLFLIYNSL